MRRPVTLSMVVVALAAGFAAASIVAGGSIASGWKMLTGTTRTRTYTINTTSTSVGGRRILICHRHGRSHYWRFSTMAIDQHALAAHLRHGDRFGACLVLHHGHPGGSQGRKDDDGTGTGAHSTGPGSGVVTVTLTTATTPANGVTGPGQGRFGSVGPKHHGHR